MTRDGIEYNLNITPYTTIVDYVGVKITYKFSSELYLNKFLEKIKITNDKKQPFNSNLTLIEDLKTYIKIEKRGFQIVKNGSQKFHSIENLKVKVTFDII